MSVRNLIFEETKKAGKIRLQLSSTAGLEQYDLEDPMTLMGLIARHIADSAESDFNDLEHIVKSNQDPINVVTPEIVNIKAQIVEIREKQAEFEMAKLYLDNIEESTKRNQLMMDEQLRQKLDLLENLNDKFNFSKRTSELDARVKAVETKTAFLESKAVEKKALAGTTTLRPVSVARKVPLTRTGTAALSTNLRKK